MSFFTSFQRFELKNNLKMRKFSKQNKDEQIGSELNHLAKKYEYNKDFFNALKYHQIDFYASVQCKTDIEAARSLANLAFCSKQIVAQDDSDKEVEFYCYSQAAFGCLVSEQNIFNPERKPPMTLLLKTIIQQHIRDQDFLEVLVSASIDNINSITIQDDSGYVSYDIIQWINLLAQAYKNIELTSLRYYNTMCNLLLTMFSYYLYVNQDYYQTMKQLFNIIEKCYLNTNPKLYPFIVTKSSNYNAFLLMFQVIDNQQYNIHSIKQIVDELQNTQLCQELITIIYNVLNTKLQQDDMQTFFKYIKHLDCYQELYNNWNMIIENRQNAEQNIIQSKQVKQVITQQQQQIIYQALQQKVILSLKDQPQNIILSICELNQFLIKYGNTQINLRWIKDKQIIDIINYIINQISIIEKATSETYLTIIAFLIMICYFYRKYLSFDIDDCKDIIYDCLDQINDSKQNKNSQNIQINYNLLEQYLQKYSIKQALITNNTTCQKKFQDICNSYTQQIGDNYYEYEQPPLLYNKEIKYDQLMLDANLILQINKQYKDNNKKFIHFTKFERPKINSLDEKTKPSKDEMPDYTQNDLKLSVNQSLDRSIGINQSSNTTKTSLIDSYKTMSFKDYLDESNIQEIVSIQIPQQNTLQHIQMQLTNLITLSIEFQDLYRQDYENISKQQNIYMLQLFSCCLYDQQSFSQIFVSLHNLYYINMTNTITNSQILYNMLEVATMNQMQMVVLDSTNIMINDDQNLLNQFQNFNEYKINTISLINSDFAQLNSIELQLNRKYLTIENLYLENCKQPSKFINNLQNLFILRIQNCYYQNNTDNQINNVNSIVNFIK